MMRFRLKGLFVVLMAAAMLQPALNTFAQSGDRFFPETGHYLDGQFVPFFDSYGGSAIFGYPITDSFTDQESQHLVQYTENARFELTQDPIGTGQSVQLAPLGEQMEGIYPAADPGDASGCRYFAETGHSTCYAFLDFFEANGGRDLFGLPISEFIIQNDRIVQYFQNFRLDWYPEEPENRQIQVGSLGREHFRVEGYDPALLQPGTSGNEAGYRVTELLLTASVQSPSLSPEGVQEVYLVLRDQNTLPVSQAAVLLIVHEPEHDRYFLMPTTNSEGISRTSFQLKQASHGSTVNLEIWVMANGMEAVARDSFSIW